MICAFKRGGKQYSGANNRFVFKSSNKYMQYSKKDIILAIKHLICECYFTIGNSVFIQTIGILMGIDLAPFGLAFRVPTTMQDYISWEW